jgi:hypothetical protein
MSRADSIKGSQPTGPAKHKAQKPRKAEKDRPKRMGLFEHLFLSRGTSTEGEKAHSFCTKPISTSPCTSNLH